jgi:arsenate reductase
VRAGQSLLPHVGEGGSPVSKETPALKRVLFVCIENSNRSQMAEAFARMHGADKVEAHSAGSRPFGRVNSRAVQFMKERGYDLSIHQSKGLNDIPCGEYEAAVTMGCGDECPLVRAKQHVDWQIPDPKEMPDAEFRAIRDLIEAKVKALLESL